jgi:hypothetical protein
MRGGLKQKARDFINPNRARTRIVRGVTMAEGWRTAVRTDSAWRMAFGSTVINSMPGRDTHAYMDGNGRMGRFLMNTMLASGGYPWTVLPVGERAEYMAALEDASVRQNIKPFAEFLSRLVKDSMKGKMPAVPST